jgi:hypothetical protein
MMCPRCGHRFVCGCNSCRERTRGQIRWKWIDGEIEACGICGLAAHADQWLDEEYWQLANGRHEWPAQYPRKSKFYLMRPGKIRHQPQDTLSLGHLTPLPVTDSL